MLWFIGAKLNQLWLYGVGFASLIISIILAIYSEKKGLDTDYTKKRKKQWEMLMPTTIIPVVKVLCIIMIGFGIYYQIVKPELGTGIAAIITGILFLIVLKYLSKSFSK